MNRGIAAYDVLKEQRSDTTASKSTFLRMMPSPTQSLDNVWVSFPLSSKRTRKVSVRKRKLHIVNVEVGKARETLHCTRKLHVA